MSDNPATLPDAMGEFADACSLQFVGNATTVLRFGPFRHGDHWDRVAKRGPDRSLPPGATRPLARPAERRAR